MSHVSGPGNNQTSCFPVTLYPAVSVYDTGIATQTGIKATLRYESLVCCDIQQLKQWNN